MRKKTGKRGKVSLLRRAASSLAQALVRKSAPAKGQQAAGKRRGAAVPKTATKRRGGNGAAARHPRRKTDIPIDQLASTYTPMQTSLKAPFRASGADRERDQEFALGFSDERWSDEDRYTNKSGDPRIGTHGRTYEPGENNE